MAELLTIAEIAKRLDLPESTVRYYRNRFALFIPTVGEGRSKRYRNDAVAVLRFVADALRSGAPAEDVAQTLQARFPVIIEAQAVPQLSAEPQAQQQQSAATQQQSAAILRTMLADALADVLRAQNEQVEVRLEALAHQVEAMTAALARERSQAAEREQELLRQREQERSQEQARHAELMAHLVTIAEQQRQRPWWLRWLRG